MSKWKPAKPIRYEHLSKNKQYGGSDHYLIGKTGDKKWQSVETRGAGGNSEKNPSDYLQAVEHPAGCAAR
ncbi:MAG: hypothetical protein U5O16_17265 [Rhodococcus sp. (in: high G+C Gram-positive bacteria)]|uniref:hypothetical protein n=1 Tax=Rhodococcus sp. TaxID=1831 RepID=UPI002AD9F3EA|nr:hypothetical protein [Rhodococcus sp. (in: high G+C Gram-positive bacteria)]